MMEADQEWITFERDLGKGITRVTRRASAQQPKGHGWLASPATQAEIRAEIKNEVETHRVNAARNVFMSRQDYKDAHEIRSAIEFMTYDNHPLDKLTPEEWAALRVKLLGA